MDPDTRDPKTCGSCGSGFPTLPQSHLFLSLWPEHVCKYITDLLLAGHGLDMVPHDVVEAGEHAEALGNLRVHGAVHVVQQVQRLADQLVPVLQETLLDLALS
jgi:hypothetical protein